MNSFCASGARNKATWSKSISDGLGRRMALRTHNLLSERIKNESAEFDEAMFQFFEMPCELIFCILGIEKSYLNEVA
jgi:hypothetical protein